MIKFTKTIVELQFQKKENVRKLDENSWKQEATNKLINSFFVKLDEIVQL